MNLTAIPTIKSITSLRYEAPALFKTIEKKSEPVYITKNNEPIGVVLSPKVFSQLWELYEGWRDQKIIDRILASSKKGDFLDFSEFDEKQRKKLNLP